MDLGFKNDEIIWANDFDLDWSKHIKEIWATTSFW